MEATILIAAIIAGATESIKNLFPGKVYGIITVIIALLTGIAIALLDVSIGLMDISIAQGIIFALGTIGVVGTVKKIG